MAKKISCKYCNEEISSKDKVCPHCGANFEKPFYRKLWFWVLVALVVGVASCGGGDETDNPNTSNEDPIVEENDETPEEEVKIEVIDLSVISRSEVIQWCDTNKLDCSIEEEHSDIIPEGDFVSQSIQTGELVSNGDNLQIIYSLGVDVPTEFKNALSKAESYSDIMSMSKAAIYDQLTSEYGENFPEDAAQYAMDNIDADWNANALSKAESYSDTMHMSKAAIHDQLVSEYGEQFTESEAQYAIDNIVADWNANALLKAESYSDTMHMSKAAIYDQLVSEYGEQFTPSEAQYAIDNIVADWNYNALQKAIVYYEDMGMSKASVYDQLVSEYGEQFTAEEAQFAVDNLDN